MQTYEEYLATMRAYHFHPLDRATWESWQEDYRKRWCTCEHTGNPASCLIHTSRKEVKP